ncbi:Cross-pathway control protein 1 [Fusarium oxysporum f. sp. albedinis]|nr:Cross-pathway control protein 1 [Fusarium oxysporum f. sp. albedinis]
MDRGLESSMPILFIYLLDALSQQKTLNQFSYKDHPRAVLKDLFSIFVVMLLLNVAEVSSFSSMRSVNSTTAFSITVHLLT